jgi:hypothetical protein
VEAAVMPADKKARMASDHFPFLVKLSLPDSSVIVQSGNNDAIEPNL